MAKTDKTGLLILGMHRSGTSALTRVLSLIGYALPKYVTGKSDGNVTGHWESALISELNESIFEELGLVWYSWGPFKLERLNTCLLYTSPSPRDQRGSRMPSSA